ncbi:hypothetical protein B0T24DRAFT_18972 [Lasiosphaeria ovina]|uniref:Prolyl 4-hydroxylase alpha subunit domain-containing protein n=1 Tax=Lasiosphaeria ovina TaxID=92902 RepID=A0AAE0TWZ7_9PEZI|nr:hypothetical protein B0T24DRAFT_18972 [Lasiosphaeria ovina]
MAMASLAKVAGISAGAVLLALNIPHIPRLSSQRLTAFVGDFPIPDYPFALPFFRGSDTDDTDDNPSEAPFVCDASHTYRTEIVSLEPLLIYIHSLVTPPEIASILRTAEPLFAPSQVTKNGRQQHTSDRTSSSAGLPRDDGAVRCVVARSRGFLGTLLRDDYDEMGPPQLVRYTAGQRFNVHHDWFDSPRAAADGTSREWNRIASFFAILQDNCTGGETYFPHAKSVAPLSPWGGPSWQGGGGVGGDGKGDGKETDSLLPESRPLWREHEDGGLAFRPVAGNALFWVNLHANWTGDVRTNHAGLPLVDGLKTAMNIWPRQYRPDT